MKKHPNKEIRAAIEYALNKGWQLKLSNGHAFGRLYCKQGHTEHLHSVWSTPKDPSGHARRLKKLIDQCQS